MSNHPAPSAGWDALCLCGYSDIAELVQLRGQKEQEKQLHGGEIVAGDTVQEGENSPMVRVKEDMGVAGDPGACP